MKDTLAINPEELLFVSGKSGVGVPLLLEAVLDRIPAPQGDKSSGLQALVFDTWFDTYRSVSTRGVTRGRTPFTLVFNRSRVLLNS